MLLATRCPHCDTVFRLQQAQLDAHGGFVRCGHCQRVFDASASLVDASARHEPPLTDSTDPAPPETGAPQHITADPRTPDADADADADAKPMDFSAGHWNAWAPPGGSQPPQPHGDPEPGATPHADAAPTPPTAAGHDDNAREPRFPADAAPFATAPAGAPPFAVTREPRAPKRRRALGGFVGALVAAALLLLAIASLAWWQRDALMIHWPVTQRGFTQACASLGCTVTPPRALDGLQLEPSALRELDGSHVLELRVPLTNRYRVALAYPSIELTLFDEANNVTVRRVLAPRDYVPAGTPIDAGLPAGAKRTMSVRIETNGTPASNFRVKIFYP